MEGNSITKFNPEEIKRKAKAFLALSDSTAFLIRTKIVYPFKIS
jgi:hypothetical protein